MTQPTTSGQFRQTTLDYHENPRLVKSPSPPTKNLINQHDLAWAYLLDVQWCAKKLSRSPSNSVRHTDG